MLNVNQCGPSKASCWRERAAAAAMAVLLCSGPCLIGEPHAASSLSTHSVDWKRLELRIIARGSHVASGFGNMDSYIALASDGRRGDETAVRLVHYYSGLESGILDERIMSGRAIRLRVSSASYCEMDTKDFAVKRVFDSDAVAKVQGALPCFVVRH